MKHRCSAAELLAGSSVGASPMTTHQHVALRHLAVLKGLIKGISNLSISKSRLLVNTFCTGRTGNTGQRRCLLSLAMELDDDSDDGISEEIFTGYVHFCFCAWGMVRVMIYKC